MTLHRRFYHSSLSSGFPRAREILNRRMALKKPGFQYSVAMRPFWFLGMPSRAPAYWSRAELRYPLNVWVVIFMLFTHAALGRYYFLLARWTPMGSKDHSRKCQRPLLLVSKNQKLADVRFCLTAAFKYPSFSHDILFSRVLLRNWLAAIQIIPEMAGYHFLLPFPSVLQVDMCPS